MTRDDIIRLAREACDKDKVDPYQNDFWAITQEELERFAALVAAAEKQKVVEYMNSRAFATGHGDTIDDLLKELEWQVAEREREACAKACEARKIIDPEYEYDRHYNQGAEHCAFAIRARGEK